MKIGIVDVDTSHPQNWIPLERELGHEVVGLWDGGAVHPPEYVREFAREHEVGRVYEDLDEMVGEVDCAVIHGCDWDSHIPKARPFVEAGKAVLIDKPMVGNLGDARQLLEWAAQGKRISGGSSLRFAREIQDYLAGEVDKPPMSMQQLLEPELCALAARQSWMNDGVEINLEDLQLDDSGYDGDSFARSYREQRYPVES